MKELDKWAWAKSSSKAVKKEEKYIAVIEYSGRACRGISITCSKAISRVASGSRWWSWWCTQRCTRRSGRTWPWRVRVWRGLRSLDNRNHRVRIRYYQIRISLHKVLFQTRLPIYVFGPYRWPTLSWPRCSSPNALVLVSRTVHSSYFSLGGPFSCIAPLVSLCAWTWWNVSYTRWDFNGNRELIFLSFLGLNSRANSIRPTESSSTLSP